MKLAGAAVGAVAVTILGLLTSSAGAGSTGPNDASASSISANGRFVAFETGADFGGPTNPAANQNVYVYDRRRDRFELISRRSKGAGGAGANGSSTIPEISADGRFVAFTSEATNLSSADETGLDVFVYDRRRDRVELVSRRSKAAGGQGQDASAQPGVSISANGRFVGFSSSADNLGGPIDSSVIYHVYVYDRRRDRIQLVSRQSAPAGGGGADADSARPSLSASGRFVAFDSDAGNLSPAAEDDHFDVFVYDRRERRVSLVSRRSGPAGAGADSFSAFPSISGNGRFVAFQTAADNLGGPIEESADNVYVYDRKRRRVQLVSRRSGGGAGGDEGSFQPVISDNGRAVAFVTNADNLGGPSEDVQNVYVYDRKLGRVGLASRRSRAAGGDGANDFSNGPDMSADGSLVSFHTGATNLGGASQLSGWDVYVYDRSARRIRLITGN